LESLAGDYQSSGLLVQVKLRADGVLTLVFPKDVPPQVRELVPLGDLRFAQKGVANNSVEFLRNPAGHITGLMLHAPYGSTFRARVGASANVAATGRGGNAGSMPATPAAPTTIVAKPSPVAAPPPAKAPVVRNDQPTQTTAPPATTAAASARSAVPPPAVPNGNSPEPTITSFSAAGLNYERDVTGLFLGDFANLRLRPDSLEFGALLNNYINAFARRCSAYLPPNRVEIMRSVCAREQYMVNRYGVQVGASTCIEYRDVGTGLYADPDLYAAETRLAAGVGLNALKDLLGGPNKSPFDTAFHAVDAKASAGSDMETLIAANGCAGPGIERFQGNMLRFARGEPGLRLSGGETLASVSPPRSSSASLADVDYGKLLDDLVSEQSKAWMVNVYVRGSVAQVTVAARDQEGRAAEVVGTYSFTGLNGRSTGSVRLRFLNGLPQCMYFSDFPTTCRTPSPRVVTAYENNKYQR